jgi:hypothetical protein
MRIPYEILYFLLISQAIERKRPSFAKNASNRTVQERFQHSDDIVNRHFSSVLYAITQLSSEIMLPPLLRTPQYIESRPKFYLFYGILK